MEQGNDIFSEIATLNKQGRKFVLATIVATKGSSPRQVGARMLIFDDRTISGTIGGGKFEMMVTGDAMPLFDSDLHHLKKTYRFAISGKNATGMNCGGEAEVFMELLGESINLIIFGAGHIGTALANTATTIFNQITIVDDQPGNLNNGETQINKILAGSGYSDNLPDISENSYVVLVTRGHQTDLAVLSKILKHECKYIGMIGSKSKMMRVREELESSGFDSNEISKIRTPIGLDIGADGPGEISIAIIAEIIAVKNGRFLESESNDDSEK